MKIAAAASGQAAMATAAAIPPPVASLLGGQRDGFSRSTLFFTSRRAHHHGDGVIRRRLLPSSTGTGRGKRGGRGGLQKPIFTLASARAKAGKGEVGRESSQLRQEEEEEEGEESSPFTVLSYIRSQHNEIMVVDTPTSRVLILDDTREYAFRLRGGEKFCTGYEVLTGIFSNSVRMGVGY